MKEKTDVLQGNRDLRRLEDLITIACTLKSRMHLNKT